MTRTEGALAVDVAIEGTRADLVLKRPDVLNAIDWAVFDGLAAAADEVRASDARVLVVSGEGRSFSSGIDFNVFGELVQRPQDMIARAQSGFRKIAALPIPTIAMVQGHALGAGLQLALACDIRVVADDASLGLLEHRFGIVPDLCGTHRLPALVGAGRAKKMIWLAERIDAAEAHRIGLAELLVAPGALRATVDDLARAIAAAPPLAVQAVKGLVDASGTRSLEEGMDAEAEAQMQMFASRDATEAVAAFFEKRTPDFTGT
jgi:enoyl-CoA hydratase/carnithine racemase